MTFGSRLVRASPAEELEAMTFLDVYVLFILPLFLLGLGYLTYWWASRQPRAR